jgi:hypothetical protein
MPIAGCYDKEIKRRRAGFTSARNEVVKLVADRLFVRQLAETIFVTEGTEGN